MTKLFVKATVCTLLLALCAAPAIKAEEFANPSLLAVENSATAEKASGFKSSEIYTFKKIKSRVAKYKEVNKEVIGWLTVPGTNINEPIVFSTKNNNYYVKRDWRGTNYSDLSYTNWNKRPATATYLDYRSVLGESWKKGTSRNLVLYGHNWNNLRAPFKIGNVEGYTMFAQLPSYTNHKFAAEHPYIYFSTSDYEGIWKVFSVSYCELSTKFPYNSPNPTKAEFKKLIGEWKQRSLYNFSTEVDENDRLLTLSTCTRQFNAGDYQRYIVVARLLRDGESEKDKVKVEVNPNIKWPTFK